MNCNVFQNHFSYIKDIAGYSRCFSCSECKRLFASRTLLKRHTKSDCTRVVHVFPGGVYKNKLTIFQILESCGITIPPETPRFFPHRIIYDLESFQSKHNLPSDTDYMSYQSHHKVCSAAVVANFAPYDTVRVFVVDDETTGHDVVIAMLRYMIEIADESYRCFIYIIAGC